MSGTPLIFAIALGTSTGDPRASLTGAGWLAVATQAEQAVADFVTIADHHRLEPRFQPRSVNGDQRARQVPAGSLDAMMIACRIAPGTRHVGIVPMASTTLTEPFLLSAQIATLDHVSRGRGGWLLDVSDAAGAARYVGPRVVPAPPDRYLDAAEHAEVVRRLWDSWEDDAEIRDVETNRFIDRRRVHHIDYAGSHLSVRGPSITPRPPQGQPIIVVRVDRPEMEPLATTIADVVILAVTEPEAVGPAADALRDRHARPDEVRILAEVDIALPGDETDVELALDGTPTGAGIAGDALPLIGTPADVAAQLAEWGQLGVDGFHLRPVSPPRDLAAIAGPLATALRRRDVLRTSYEQPTLRARLGLPRPANRYATA
jgi:alkanesulfonate monooxygenase SsuD/methylene tetrahydromethanopterin reductase-like flavin-dependent oxidoreductase (luciferase family)